MKPCELIIATELAKVLSKSALQTFSLSRAWGFDDPSADDVVKTLKDLRDVQSSALIIGGMALLFHGYERLTTNVDLLYSLDDSHILERLESYFRIESVSKIGWHRLLHKETNFPLRLVPEGYKAAFGVIPGPDRIGGKDGFVSLDGLIWLKLISIKGRDPVDIIEMAKIKSIGLHTIKDKLPIDIQERFEGLFAIAMKEIENDPHRLPDEIVERERIRKERIEAARARRNAKAKR